MVEKKAPTWYAPSQFPEAATPTLRALDFFKIFIRHVPTDKEVAFDGWVTSFSDNYTSQWNEEMVYGRMDPLSTFQGTRRNISIAFDVVSDSKNHCLTNMLYVRELTQFLYPLYTTGPHPGQQNQQNVLKAGPLLAMRWTNLISSPNNPGQRLIGYINGGLNYAPDMNEGGFLAGPLEGGGGAGDVPTATSGIANYFPKKFSLSFTFTVIHTHLVGWSSMGGKSGGTTFIFGGNERIGDGFPNAQIAPPPPPPPAEGDTTQDTTDDANETLDEQARTEEEIENLLDDDRRTLDRSPATTAAQGEVTGGSAFSPFTANLEGIEAANTFEAQGHGGPPTNQEWKDQMCEEDPGECEGGGI